MSTRDERYEDMAILDYGNLRAKEAAEQERAVIVTFIRLFHRGPEEYKWSEELAGRIERGEHKK